MNYAKYWLPTRLKDASTSWKPEDPLLSKSARLASAQPIRFESGQSTVLMAPDPDHRERLLTVHQRRDET